MLFLLGYNLRIVIQEGIDFWRWRRGGGENKNLVGGGGGGVDFLSGGYERIFGWWGDSPHLPSRENPVIITYAPESFRILFI